MTQAAPWEGAGELIGIFEVAAAYSAQGVDPTTLSRSAGTGPEFLSNYVQSQRDEVAAYLEAAAPAPEAPAPSEYVTNALRQAAWLDALGAATAASRTPIVIEDTQESP